MVVSLLKTFRELDAGTKEVLADLDSPLRLAFAALSIAHEKAEYQRLSAEHILACLEAAGVAVSRTSVSRALARAGDRVSRSLSLDGETLYRLMTKGEREIAPLIGGGGVEIVRFDGTRPRTARIRLGEFLSSLSGLVRICDPYYGVRTLDSLDHFSSSCRVRFLTGRTNETGRKLAGALSDFKRERPDIELRIANKPSELHDRYVLTSDKLFLIGHGLKDIGGKESFLVRIDKHLGRELIRDTRRTFDARWAKTTPL